MNGILFLFLEEKLKNDKEIMLKAVLNRGICMSLFNANANFDH